MPASGAMNTITIGHGVIRKPVCTWLMPSVFCSMNGSETNASICAVNEQNDVAIDSAKIGNPAADR